MKAKIILACLFLILILILPIPISADNSSNLPPIEKKVLVVVFNPILEDYGNQRLVDYLRWNDPNTLTQEYINAIKETSWNIVSYEVTEKLEFDDYPIKPDGFKYTDQSYLQCWDDHDTCHSPDIMDYPKVIADYHLCDIVNQKNYDEIWLFGGPWFGFWEAVTTGPEAFGTNGPPFPSSCNKLIHVMGFNYERSLSEMLEDLGHRTEGTMTHVYGGGEPYGSWPRSTQDTGWKKYTIGDKDIPNYAQCGTVHCPPNAEASKCNWQQQDLYNLRFVPSYCDDWYNYPNSTGTATNLNCSAWNCSHLGWEKYWLKHLPHATGSTGGKINNWWRYVVDYEQAVKTDLARSVFSAYLTDEITYDQNHDQKINGLDFGLTIR
jgi:hypothetical protein